MKDTEYYNVLSEIKSIIQNTDFENHVYAVGGCVRDSIMGNQSIKDIDIVVDLENGGIKLAEWLNNNNYLTHPLVTYPTYGTAMFCLNKFPEIELEAVETRKEQYKDKESRNPSVQYGTLEEDCKRRDLTINAIYYDISNGKIIDLVGGITDIHNHIIQTPCDPDVVFNDDPLRMLRCCRFSSRYGWDIQPTTLEGIKKNAFRIKIISQERITDEMIKSLTSAKKAGELFKMWNECGLFEYIGYKINTERSTDNNDYPLVSTLVAQLNNLSDFHSKAEEFFAALFVNHYKKLGDMKLPNDFIDTVKTLNKARLWMLKHTVCDYNARRFSREFGSKYELCLDYIRSWCFTPIFRTYETQWYKDFSKLIQDLRKRGSMVDGTSKLPIDGNDIMRLFDLKPSSKVKEYLEIAWDIYCMNPKTTKNDLENNLKFRIMSM